MRNGLHTVVKLALLSFRVMTQTLALPTPRQGYARRFVQGMKQPDQRRYFFAYLGGKLLAVGLVLLVMKYVIGPFLHSVAGAQDATAPPIEDVVNATEHGRGCW